jgi:hypothetical protein
MSLRGYSHVTPDGYASFRDDLDQAPWSSIPALDPSAHASQGSALLAAPWLVGQKAALVWVLGALTEALSGESRPLEAADAQWDAAQRRLHFALAERESSDDPAQVSAAERLRLALFEGRGLSYTRLPHAQEVDAGLRQGQVSQQPEVQRDAQALGLQGHLDAVAATTSNLQGVLKKAEGTTTRRRSVHESMQACHSCFNNVHDQLAFARERLHDADPQAVQLTACLASMQALLDRFRSLPSAPKPPTP